MAETKHISKNLTPVSMQYSHTVPPSPASNLSPLVLQELLLQSHSPLLGKSPQTAHHLLHL